MNKILFSIIALAILTACNSPKTETQTIEIVKGTAYYGDSVKNDQVIDLVSIQTEMKGERKRDMKIKGVVKEVCQQKGCWMTMTLDNGDEMRVTFKDYAFFMPMDCSGKTAIVDGVAKIEVTSIADLKEFAKDDNQSKEAIAAIKEPKSELVFEASGVILK